ncbi:hypothetical protein SAMN05216320_101587 [Duganella sp. OV458]|nr:hypothetical protein SAMN05216320_101587 [Duganella sp. OV458]SDI71649.1 hypothetical protein SAMN05428973_101830 [Duganella sp. OV510]
MPSRLAISRRGIGLAGAEACPAQGRRGRTAAVIVRTSAGKPVLTHRLGTRTWTRRLTGDAATRRSRQRQHGKLIAGGDGGGALFVATPYFIFAMRFHLPFEQPGAARWQQSICRQSTSQHHGNSCPRTLKRLLDAGIGMLGILLVRRDACTSMVQSPTSMVFRICSMWLPSKKERAQHAACPYRRWRHLVRQAPATAGRWHRLQDAALAHVVDEQRKLLALLLPELRLPEAVIWHRTVFPHRGLWPRMRGAHDTLRATRW